VTKATD